MSIREMTISDYNGAYQLWTSTPGMGLNNLDDTYDGIKRFLKRNPTTCFVSVNDDEEIAGVILCGHDGRRGFIYHTAVKVSERKQGIGSALVDAALQALQAEGIVKAALVVFTNNENGNDFWEKRGFISREDLNYRNKTLSKDLVRMNHDEINVPRESEGDKPHTPNKAPNINIRPAQSSDYPIIESLLAQITQVHHAIRPDIFRSSYKTTTDDSIVDLQEADAPVFVAETDNNNIVGCLRCIICRERGNALKIDRDWLVIDDICVEEQYRRAGIGRKLVDYVYQLAKEKGIHKIELNVYQDNSAALQFYKDLGFKTQKCVMELDTLIQLSSVGVKANIQYHNKRSTAK